MQRFHTAPIHAIRSATIILRQSIEYSLDIIFFMEFVVVFMLLGIKGEYENFLSGLQHPS